MEHFKGSVISGILISLAAGVKEKKKMCRLERMKEKEMEGRGSIALKELKRGEKIKLRLENNCSLFRLFQKKDLAFKRKGNHASKLAAYMFPKGGNEWLP